MTELAAAVEAHLAPLRRAAADLEAELAAFADRVQAEADAVAHRSCQSMRVVWPRTQKRERRAELARIQKQNRRPGLAIVLDANDRHGNNDRYSSPQSSTPDADHSPTPGQIARTRPAAAQAPPRPDCARRYRGSVCFSPPTIARGN